MFAMPFAEATRGPREIEDFVGCSQAEAGLMFAMPFAEATRGPREIEDLVGCSQAEAGLRS